MRRRDPIDAFPGEDRGFGGNALYIDLIPSTSFFVNARKAMSRNDWRSLAATVRARAEDLCEICRSGHGSLDVHERWIYELVDGRHVQRLIRLIALCQRCHTATHMGLARKRGLEADSLTHLAVTNGWTPAETREHEADAFALWRHRSKHTWDVDVTMIERLGYRVRVPLPSVP